MQKNIIFVKNIKSSRNMKSDKINKCKGTLSNSKYERDKIKTLYNWVKTDYINLEEYIILSEWVFMNYNSDRELLS